MKTHLLVFLLLIVNYSFGQEENCTCLANLEETSQVIKKAISYQVQVKKLKKEQAFEDWKRQIEQEITSDSLSSYFCLGYLQKYISFVKDRHNQIYSTEKDIASLVPIYPNDFDPASENTDPISGIYYQGSDKIFVKQETDNVYFGIQLTSNSSDWKRGMIRLRLQRNKDNTFQIFEYYKNGFIYYQSAVRVTDGRIESTFWNKEAKYFFNKNHEGNFNFENLNASTNYIGIKTLRRTSPLIREANEFYEGINSQLNAQTLIIDLRNNGGGSTEQIKPLIKLLKKNKRIEKIYVLLNFKSGSAAELGAYLLDKDPRTILAGENTRGMLTYGYGNKAISGQLACSKIQYDFSKKVTNQKLLPYETTGLVPELVLDNRSDWIEQIMALEQ